MLKTVANHCVEDEVALVEDELLVGVVVAVDLLSLAVVEDGAVGFRENLARVVEEISTLGRFFLFLANHFRALNELLLQKLELLVHELLVVELDAWAIDEGDALALTLAVEFPLLFDLVDADVFIVEEFEPTDELDAFLVDDFELVEGDDAVAVVVEDAEDFLDKLLFGHALGSSHGVPEVADFEDHSFHILDFKHLLVV